MFLLRRRMNPGHELGRLQNDMNRMLDGFFGGDGRWPTLAVRGQVAWPKLDVSETEDAIHISAELPGLKQEEIEIEVLAGHSSHQRREERRARKSSASTISIQWNGRLAGSIDPIPLPVEVDAKNADATFKDGVLTLSLPKLTPVAAQKITVKSAN